MTGLEYGRYQFWPTPLPCPTCGRCPTCGQQPTLPTPAVEGEITWKPAPKGG
jgi:hypothetical protein